MWTVAAISSKMWQKSSRFHQIHGKDVVMYHDWTTAKRVKTNGQGLVFTSHPVKINEKITIKLCEINHDGTIAIGFTSKNPHTIEKSSDLKRGDISIFSLPSEVCVNNTTLFFSIGNTGTITYGVDDAEKGHFHTRIVAKAPLWAVFDLQTINTTIQLTNTKSKHEPIKLKLKSLKLCQDRGRNVYISKNKAKKANKSSNACYVFTENPVVANEHVVVKILETDCTKTCTLTLGVTSCDPHLLEQKELPDKCESLLERQEYWLLVSDPSWIFKKNDEVSFLISDSGEMKIGKNGSQLLRVVHVDRTMPLWGVFEFATLNGIEVKSALVPIGVEPTAPLEEKRKTDIGDKESECIVCYDNSAEAAFYPCGHMCLCFACAKKQWRKKGCGKCPMCRAVIRDVLKIYRT